MPQLFRKQSTDPQHKKIYWFLYYGNVELYPDHFKSEFKMSAPAVFFIAAFKCAAALTQKFDVLLQYCFQ